MPVTAPARGERGGGRETAPAAVREGRNVGLPDVPAVEGAPLTPAPGWPIWLKDYTTGERTEETSGVAFAGREPDGTFDFFLADDIGAIHFCRVKQLADTGRVTVGLQQVGIGKSFADALAEHERWDFEDIALAPFSGRGSPDRPLPQHRDGILAVEGSGADFREQTALLRIRFVRREQSASGAERREAGWQVECLGEATPGTRFWQADVQKNRGIEGVAESARFIVIGLESLNARSEFSTLGAMLYLFDRQSQRFAALSTRLLGIHSVCGLSAVNDSVTLVLDRNRMAIDVIRWDPIIPGRVRACHRFPLDLPAPGGYRYAVPSVEGLTVDEDGDLWCVTDPGNGGGRAAEAVPETVAVYLAAGIPMMYRFAGEPVWQATGLSHLWENPR